MGNLGWSEILIILVIALIIFGPRKLPELGKTLGNSLAQFRKASEDFKRTWEEEVEIEKRRLEAPPPAVAPATGETYGPTENADNNASEMSDHALTTEPASDEPAVAEAHTGLQSGESVPRETNRDNI